MGTEYTPLFLFILVALLTSVVFLAVTHLLGPKKITATKQMPYESGMDPFGDARQRFDIRFYLIAIEFLVFDVELLFLYPWAVAQWSAVPGGAVASSARHGVGVPPDFGGLVFFAIMIFIGVLAAAFAYSWRKGIFEWR